MKPMKILIIEDDVNECNNFRNCINKRDEFELVGITDSDVEGLKLTRLKHPDGIVLDIELNNSRSGGNTDSLEFIPNLRKMNLNFKPIIIVTTHINSDTTYQILHKEKVDLIAYKDHPKYSPDYVLNSFLRYRDNSREADVKTFKEELESEEDKISYLINCELDLIGISNKMKGRKYIFDAIMYLIQNEDSDLNVIQYLTKVHKKSETTITNGIKNAIIHAWRSSSVDDLLIYYTAKINYKTGIPTPMEFIYFYVDKIKKEI